MPVTDGHRIIEIGCVELMGRRLTGRHFHVYLQPDREIDEGAIAVHGITNDFAQIKPQDRADISEHCSILDTLLMARERHPGQRNSLDALCKRYGVDNSGRDLHGALLDAEILADVYLTMTGGQTNLSLAGDGSEGDSNGRQQPSAVRRLPAERALTRVIRASADELALHQARLAAIEKSAGAPALWQQLEQAGSEG